MKRILTTILISSTILLSCGSDDEARRRQVEGMLFTFYLAGLFNNFCGAPVPYPVGPNSVTIEAGVRHWFTFPSEFNSLYNVTVNEAPGQNVLVETIECVTGSSRQSLINTSATGQIETFHFRRSSSGIILLCSEGCNAPINFTIPANPAPPQ